MCADVLLGAEFCSGSSVPCWRTVLSRSPGTGVGELFLLQKLLTQHIILIISSDRDGGSFSHRETVGMFHLVLLFGFSMYRCFKDKHKIFLETIHPSSASSFPDIIPAAGMIHLFHVKLENSINSTSSGQIALLVSHFSKRSHFWLLHQFVLNSRMDPNHHIVYKFISNKYVFKRFLDQYRNMNACFVCSIHFHTRLWFPSSNTDFRLLWDPCVCRCFL